MEKTAYASHKSFLVSVFVVFETVQQPSGHSIPHLEFPYFLKPAFTSSHDDSGKRQPLCLRVTAAMHDIANVPQLGAPVAEITRKLYIAILQSE